MENGADDRSASEMDSKPDGSDAGAARDHKGAEAMLGAAVDGALSMVSRQIEKGVITPLWLDHLDASVLRRSGQTSKLAWKAHEHVENLEYRLEAARREERLRRSAAFRASTDVLNRGPQHAQRHSEAAWHAGGGDAGESWAEWPQAVEEETAAGIEARRLVRRLQREKRERQRRRREQAMHEAELLVREAEQQQRQREEARQRMEREREEARRRRHEEHEAALEARRKEREERVKLGLQETEARKQHKPLYRRWVEEYDEKNNALQRARERLDMEAKAKGRAVPRKEELAKHKQLMKEKRKLQRQRAMLAKREQERMWQQAEEEERKLLENYWTAEERARIRETRAKEQQAAQLQEKQVQERLRRRREFANEVQQRFPVRPSSTKRRELEQRVQRLRRPVQPPGQRESTSANQRRRERHARQAADIARRRGAAKRAETAALETQDDQEAEQLLQQLDPLSQEYVREQRRIMRFERERRAANRYQRKRVARHAERAEQRRREQGTMGHDAPSPSGSEATLGSRSTATRLAGALAYLTSPGHYDEAGARQQRRRPSNRDMEALRREAEAAEARVRALEPRQGQWASRAPAGPYGGGAEGPGGEEDDAADAQRVSELSDMYIESIRAKMALLTAAAAATGE